jgi:hypothetical protein
MAGLDTYGFGRCLGRIRPFEHAVPCCRDQTTCAIICMHVRVSTNINFGHCLPAGILLWYSLQQQMCWSFAHYINRNPERHCCHPMHLNVSHLTRRPLWGFLDRSASPWIPFPMVCTSRCRCRTNNPPLARRHHRRALPVSRLWTRRRRARRTCW